MAGMKMSIGDAISALSDILQVIEQRALFLERAHRDAQYHRTKHFKDEVKAVLTDLTAETERNLVKLYPEFAALADVQAIFSKHRSYHSFFNRASKTGDLGQLKTILLSYFDKNGVSSLDHEIKAILEERSLLAKTRVELSQMQQVLMQADNEQTVLTPSAIEKLSEIVSREENIKTVTSQRSFSRTDTFVLPNEELFSWPAFVVFLLNELPKSSAEKGTWLMDRSEVTVDDSDFRAEDSMEIMEYAESNCYDETEYAT